MTLLDLLSHCGSSSFSGLCFMTRLLKRFLYLAHTSVQFSCSVVSDSLRPHELQHARPPCPSPTPGVHPDSHPSSQWCHPDISSTVVLFSSCPQSLPASESFQWVNSLHEVAKVLEFHTSSYIITELHNQIPGLFSQTLLLFYQQVWSAVLSNIPWIWQFSSYSSVMLVQVIIITGYDIN